MSQICEAGSQILTCISTSYMFWHGLMDKVTKDVPVTSLDICFQQNPGTVEFRNCICYTGKKCPLDTKNAKLQQIIIFWALLSIRGINI